MGTWRKKFGLVATLALMAGGAAWAHEDVSAEIAGLSRLIQANPKVAKYRIQRAELYHVERKVAEAVSDAQKGLELDADLHEAHLLLSKLWLESGQYGKALDEANLFLIAQPNNPEGQIARGRALAKLDRPAEAVEIFNQAIDRLDSPDPDLCIERAEAMARLGPEKCEEALRGLERAMEKAKGDSPALQFCAIDIELRLKRYDAAMARLEKVAPKKGRKDYWLSKKGQILEKAGRDSEALAAYRNALVQIANLPESRRQTRMTLELEDRLHTAIDGLERKLEKRGPKP